MSLSPRGLIRCDWCGKFTRNELGEYTKPDGISAGYIHAPDWDKNGDKDICEECARGHCPKCGSGRIVQQTPTVPGPHGWGGRCKACGHHWPEIPVDAFGQVIPDDDDDYDPRG